MSQLIVRSLLQQIKEEGKRLVVVVVINLFYKSWNVGGRVVLVGIITHRQERPKPVSALELISFPLVSSLNLNRTFVFVSAMRRWSST